MNKIIIFDFDLTLTQIHTTNCISRMKYTNSEKSIEELTHQFLSTKTKNEVLSEMLLDKRAIFELREFKRMGGIIAIVTYGYKSMINVILRTYDLIDIFDIILTPADFNLKEGADNTHALCGKNIMIDRVIKESNRKLVLFFDDTSVNIKYANDYKFVGVYVEAIQVYKGLLITDMNTINRFVKIDIY